MSLPPPYYNDDEKSFAFSTVRQRWPKIIETAIADVQSAIQDHEEHAHLGDRIVNQLLQLNEDFANDAIVQPFTASEIQINPDLKHYNESLEKLNQDKKVTWRTGPWLYLECYLYQYINNFFIIDTDPFWKEFDVFGRLKTQTFKQSESGVLELCKRYEVLSSQLGKADSETLFLLFKEFIDISLWGNATDLSLLAGNVSLEDIKSVQGAEVRKKNEEKILVNDISQAWKELIGDNNRVDIVLDNSGFELFTDLILVLFLLDAKIVNEVHLHCKEIPWFVSDTMPKDFQDLLSQLVDTKFYPEIHAKDPKAIKLVHDELQNYYKNYQLIINHDPFWTLDYNYWSIPKFTKLYDELKKSNLIIFKGDLNYRKLTGDLEWPTTTPFKTAIQDLATSGLPILSLRTCKADVVVGLPEGVNEKLIKEYENMGNQNGRLWSSSGKWAVISFNK
ncbi:hypothetical protein SBY92_003218 [Candida maltosa Xu316]